MLLRGASPRYPPELESEVAQLVRLSDKIIFSPSLGEGSHKAHAARVLLRREFKEAIDTCAPKEGAHGAAARAAPAAPTAAPGVFLS